MSARQVVQDFYAAINRRDVAGAIALIDDHCTYQDFNFSEPFEGKVAVQALFEATCRSAPENLLFVIDKITKGDGLSVGMTWHVELDGIPFPNGRGVSFYRLSADSGKIVFARDVVEPPVKPGKVAFGLIRLVAPLVKRFLDPQKTQKRDIQ
ncbi:MAG: nuclear transport factor 2 family protein [Cyanobacteria bacterium P01_D01_bin.14]